MYIWRGSFSLYTLYVFMYVLDQNIKPIKLYWSVWVKLTFSQHELCWQVCMKRFGLRWAVPEVPALLPSTAVGPITHTHTHRATLRQVITSDIINVIWHRNKSSLSTVPKQEKNRKWTISVCDGKQPLVCKLLTKLPSNLNLTFGLYCAYEYC